MTIQQIIDQGPLSGPERPLWPEINPYQQQWIEDAHGQGTVDKLLALGSTEERKTELLRMDEAKVAKARSEHGANNKATIDATHTLAGRFTEFGRFEDADKLYNELLANLGSTLDGEKQRLGITYGLAHLRAKQGRWAESEKLQRETLPLGSQWPLGMDSMQYLGAWRSIIEAVAHQPGRWDEANDMLETGYGLVAKMKGGRFEKFHNEELEAMNEVRNMVQSLKPSDDTAGTAKL